MRTFLDLAKLTGTAVALTFLFLAEVSGAPHEGEPFQLRQPDGTLVDVLVWGDEFHQDVESPDGYTLVRDEDGWICYAVLSPDKNEYVSSGTRYPSKGQSPALRKKVRINKESLLRKQRKNKDILGYEELIEPTPNLPLFSPAPSDEQITPAEPRRVTGLTLLIEFPDVKSTVTRGAIDDFCNQQGYAENRNNGSVYDYFRDVSNGQMLYTNFVTPFITADNNKSYYDRGEGYGYVQELITNVLNKLKSQGFDLSQVTIQNNRVLALNIFYAGSPSAGWANGLWPHSGTYRGGVTINGIGFSRYQISSLGSTLRLGTFIHENGHMVMRWPDLYSYEDHSNGVGRWCVMNSVNPSTNPQQPNAHFRNLAGWISTTDITGRPRGTEFSHTANSHSAYTYVRNTKEFYIIEARRRTGRSSGIPGDGLLIWHVHTDGLNTNPSKGFPLVALVQADGKRDLERRVNSGDGGDPFSLANNPRFNNATNPAARWHDGVAAGIDLAEISSANETMTFTIGQIAEITTYTLTVVNGDGSGTYAPGDTVSITAPATRNGEEFLRWSSSSLSVNQPHSSHTSIIMGSANATITALFCEKQSMPGIIQAESAGFLQDITITSSSDEGNGEQLRIRATGALAEYLVTTSVADTYNLTFRVASTEGGKLVLRDVTNSKILDTIYVPQTGGLQSWQSVQGREFPADTGTALWRIESVSGSYNLNWFAVNALSSLQVVHGKGSGIYAVGSVIQIEADEPPEEWKYFTGWITDAAQAVLNQSQPITTITIGDSPIVVTATYADSPTVGIIMPAGTGTIVTVSDTFFYDDGGKYSGYSRDFSGEIVLKPASEGCGVVMDFEMLDINSSGSGPADSLLIYSGSAANKVLLFVINGNQNPGQIRSTSPDGHITVSFVSSGGDPGAGWKVHLTTEAILGVNHSVNHVPLTFDITAGHKGTVNIQLPQSGFVKVSLYDMRGRLAAVLFEGNKLPGFYTIKLSESHGSKLSSGFYLAKMTAGSYAKCIGLQNHF